MSFLVELHKTIDRWNQCSIEDEWLFEKFRQQYVNTMSSQDAFQAIGCTISILINISDESTAVEVLQTIINLARQSNTTEVPMKLAETKDTLISQFNNWDYYAREKLEELFRYYRLDTNGSGHKSL